jgi:superfamily II DNA helicase RecQ
MEEGKKFVVEFKQTAKGFWYIGSLKAGADSVEELDKFIDSTVKFLHSKVDKINKGNFKPAASQQDIVLNDEERRLFEKLKSMRMDLAKAENISPFIVSHDSVLKKFAKSKPMTKEEMLNIDGVGERNFDKYGVYFLKIIRSTVSG